jgi:hypothetical protein
MFDFLHNGLVVAIVLGLAVGRKVGGKTGRALLGGQPMAAVPTNYR